MPHAEPEIYYLREEERRRLDAGSHAERDRIEVEAAAIAERIRKPIRVCTSDGARCIMAFDASGVRLVGEDEGVMPDQETLAEAAQSCALDLIQTGAWKPGDAFTIDNHPACVRMLEDRAGGKVTAPSLPTFEAIVREQLDTLSASRTPTGRRRATA